MLRALGFAVVGIIAVAGCGGGSGYGELQLVDVKGKVTLDGQPLAGALVRFEDADRSGSEGITDGGGNYRLMYDSEHPGCRPGAKTVRVTQAIGEGEGASSESAEGEEGTKRPETIPAAYNTQSTLKADVSKGNKTFNFDLKSTP